MPKFGFVAGGHHLKFRNSVLIELCGSAAGQFVLIGQAVDQEASVVGALAQNRSGGVTVGIGLAVDGHAGNELQKSR